MAGKVGSEGDLIFHLWQFLATGCGVMNFVITVGLSVAINNKSWHIHFSWI